MADLTPKVDNNPLHSLVMLLGQEDRDWEYMETDPDWWGIRLVIRRN